MKTTRIDILISLLFCGTLVGWAIEQSLIGAGQPSFSPPLTFSITMIVIGALLIVAVQPIKRHLKDPKRALNPLYATRILYLAKASVLVGTLLSGLAAGAIVFRLLLPEPNLDFGFWQAVVAVASGVILASAALYVEYSCRLPPDDADKAKKINRAPSSPATPGEA